MIAGQCARHGADRGGRSAPATVHLPQIVGTHADFKQLSALGRADAHIYVFGAIDDAGHEVRNDIAGGHTAGGHIAGGHGHESAVSGEPAVSSLLLASPALSAAEGRSELPAWAFSLS